jgi:hypothetical protein
VVAVPPQRFERGDGAAVQLVEPLRVGECADASQLAEHLALARPADMELVQVLRDRLVVSGEQLEPLEWVVDRIPFGLLDRHDSILGQC